jgi:hypothetical protein
MVMGYYERMTATASATKKVLLIPSIFLWRTSPSLGYSEGRGGEELEEHCTYLNLGLVASAVTVTFELQIHILLVAMGEKLRVIHFHLTQLKYIVTGKNSKFIMMNVRWWGD